MGSLSIGLGGAISYFKVLSNLLTLSVMPLRRLVSNNNQQKIKVGDFFINYEKVGTGHHTILCLPGALGSIDTDFRPQLSTLDASKFTIIAWDPPGYGRSRPPDREFSIGAQLFYRDARTAGQLMKELKEDRYSILGWSDGGVTGLIMAAIFPNSIRKLVVTAAHAFINEKLYNSIKRREVLSPKMRATMAEIYDDAYFRQTWHAVGQAKIKMFEKEGEDICKNELPKIKCPALVIHGKEDRIVGIEHAEYIHQHIKNSRLFIMEDGKHNLHLKHFEKFNRLVEDFLLEK